MRFRSEKDQEYYDYIKEHISNVKKAFDIFGKSLCSKAHVPLSVVEDLVKNHDVSKFSEEEFEGYRQWFYPRNGEAGDPEIFDKAWEHHYTVNKHHPEHYVQDDGTAEKMPDMYVVEMLLDWAAMSMRAKNYPSDWYEKEKNRLVFHSETRKFVEALLPILGHHEVFRG